MVYVQFQSTLPLRGVTFDFLEEYTMVKFQSTLPLRGVTFAGGIPCGAHGISIHTPLAGSDSQSFGNFNVLNQFQSTLPLRGVTFVAYDEPLLLVFQSTLPLRGVTQDVSALHRAIDISIHTPLAGSDPRLP